MTFLFPVQVLLGEDGDSMKASSVTMLCRAPLGNKLIYNANSDYNRPEVFHRLGSIQNSGFDNRCICIFPTPTSYLQVLISRVEGLQRFLTIALNVI